MFHVDGIGLRGCSLSIHGAENRTGEPGELGEFGLKELISETGECCDDRCAKFADSALPN
jgi:hypothetical protein